MARLSRPAEKEVYLKVLPDHFDIAQFFRLFLTQIL